MLKKLLSDNLFKRYAILIIVGIFAGCVICRFVSKEVLEQNTGILEWAEIIKNSSIKRYNILTMLVERRFVLFIIIAALGLTSAGKCIINLFLLIFGAGVGSFVSSFLRLCGVKAIPVVLCFFLPHYILYIPAFAILYYNICRLNASVSWKNKEFRMKSSRIIKNPVVEYIIGVLACFFLIMLGIVLETYINPFLLKRSIIIL